MKQFPKIARVRMAAQMTGAHPEAELLNAFAENALAGKEREGVLAHLAVCANCREIVSLAAEARPEGAPLVKPVRGGFRWATFQWAAVAASVAIVTVAVLVVGPRETRKHEPANQAAMQRQPAREPIAPAATPSENSTDEASRTSVPKPEITAKERAQEKKALAATGSGSGAGVGTGLAGGIGGDSYRIGEDKKALRDIETLGRLPEKKEAAAEPTAKSAPSRDFAFGKFSGRDTDTFAASVPVAPPTQPAQGAVLAQKQIAPAAPPARTMEGERGRAEEQANTGNELRKDNPRAALDASTESVQTSAQVPTKAPPAAAPASKAKYSAAEIGGISRVNTRATRTWRLYSGKVQSSDDGGTTWKEHGPANDVQLTKVVAAGEQIWAGGKAGALFVSRDNGQSWTKVSLTGDDIIPLADVTEIKIASPQLVDVLLNSGDNWQSGDGGKSFRLLPHKP
jgi:hypothetical protein